MKFCKLILCLEKLLKDCDFESIGEYLIQLSSISRLSVNVGAVAYLVWHLIKVQNLILAKIVKIPDDMKNKMKKLFHQ